MQEKTTITLHFRTAGYAQASFSFIRNMLRVIQANGGELLPFPEGPDSLIMRFRHLHTEYRRRAGRLRNTEGNPLPAGPELNSTTVTLEDSGSLQGRLRMERFHPEEEDNGYGQFFIQLCFMLTLTPAENGPDTHDFTGECRRESPGDGQTVRVTSEDDLLRFECCENEMVHHELKRVMRSWSWKDRKGLGRYPESPEMTREILQPQDAGFDDKE